MDIVERAKGIILKPKEEWEKIKTEPTTVIDLYKSYLVIMAAIPLVARYIGSFLSAIIYHYPIVRFYLVLRVVSYIISLALIFILALIIDELAPNFSSKRNQINSFKLVAYSMTPYFVAGILYLFYSFIPIGVLKLYSISPILKILYFFLEILSFLAGLYGLYVLYLGFKAGLMETPPEKVMGYFVVTGVMAIVIMLLVGLIERVVFHLGSLLLENL